MTAVSLIFVILSEQSPQSFPFQSLPFHHSPVALRAGQAVGRKGIHINVGDFTAGGVGGCGVRCAVFGVLSV
jgi:hypothetical protein